MKDTEWKFAGSRWWKFDFHSHTPASSDYGKGDENLKKRTPDEWLLDYMKAGIDCVAVTDHNSGAWIDQLKNTYAEMKMKSPEGFRELFLFPGVEITVQGGIHILAIFDNTADTTTISALLGACKFPPNNFGSSEACTGESITNVISEIANAGAIPILAHVNEQAGLFTRDLGGLTINAILQSKDLFCCELTESRYVFPESYKSNKTNWSKVAGSDSHKPDEAGRRYTWVKMGTPSLEGLRLALLDGGDFSLLRFNETQLDPNTFADFIIKSIEIKNAQYCGRGDNPLLVEFNPWLNCIIGGRGTGKSTILEFLRIVMRREKEIEEFKKIKDESELLNSFNRFRQVPSKRGESGALQNGTKVIAECIRDSADFLVQWANDGSSVSIEEKLPDGTIKQSPGEIHSRFPVRIYSQKQLFEIASNPEALLSIIDETPEVDKHEWQSNYEQICAQYHSLKSKSRELEVQIKEEALLKGELEDVKRKITLLEKGEFTNIIKEYQIKRSQEKEVEQFTESLHENIIKLQQIKIETIIPRKELFADSEDAILINKLIDEFINKINSVNSILSQLKTEVLKLEKDFCIKIEESNWKRNLQTTIKNFNDLIGKLKAEGVSNPDEYGILIQKKQTFENKIERIKNLKNSKESIENQAEDELKKILIHRQILTTKRKEFLSRTLENNSFIKIDIEECGDRKNLESSFRDLIGCEEKFQNDILSEDGQKGLLRELMESFSYEKLSKLKNELKDIILNRSKMIPADKRFFERIQKNFFNEKEDSIDLWFPEDGITVSYNRDQEKSKFVSIEQGSPGQKTAAILAFLLSYGKEPIILDQPEDDLDNHLIFDLVVKQIRENKKRRQIIIVTHNPNIVVNGDAEMIYALDFKNGQVNIIESGCLQKKGVRLEICRVMEGGKRAFEQRFRRIHIGE